MTSPPVLQHPLLWKALSAVLLLCILVQQFSLHSVPVRVNQIPGPAKHSELPLAGERHLSATEKDAGAWSYEWARDRDNLNLNIEQCDAAFPELYNEIDRAVYFWSEPGRKVTSESIELVGGNDGGVRVLIAGQELRIIETRGLGRTDFRHRIIAVLQQIQTALNAAQSAGQPLPDTEFTVVVDDKPIVGDKARPLWGFTRAFANPRHDNIWVIPDFHFFGAPPEAEGWSLQQTKSREHDSPLDQKIAKVAWRGVEWTNPDVRKPLLNVTEGQPWADVVRMSWDNRESVIPMASFCKFRYVVNTEGRAWSARMTHLLNCDSLLIVHDVEWIAHYYHLLDTETNCVRVERDFSDLEEKVKYFNEHLDEAQKIADAAKTTFRERYTTPAATACYWRRLLRSWATVAFKPKTTEQIKAKTKLSPAERLRGIAFAQFIVHDNTKDYPYEEPKPKQKPKPKPEAQTQIQVQEENNVPSS